MVESIMPSQLELRLAQGSLLVDVREEAEFRAGSHPLAMNWPAGNWTTQAAVRTLVIVCCLRGNRSRAAAGRLAAMGYSVAWLAGGLSAWSRFTGRPLPRRA